MTGFIPRPLNPPPIRPPPQRIIIRWGGRVQDYGACARSSQITGFRIQLFATELTNNRIQDPPLRAGLTNNRIQDPSSTSSLRSSQITEFRIHLSDVELTNNRIQDPPLRYGSHK